MSGAILAAGTVQLTDMFIHFVNLDPQFSYLAGRPRLLHNATHRQNIPASCLAITDRRDDAEKYTN
ncbi:hypothetical protein VCV18_004076 [Metarhizium anisopliae]